MQQVGISFEDGPGPCCHGHTSPDIGGDETPRLRCVSGRLTVEYCISHREVKTAEQDYPLKQKHTNGPRQSDCTEVAPTLVIEFDGSHNVLVASLLPQLLGFSLE